MSRSEEMRRVKAVALQVIARPVGRCEKALMDDLGRAVVAAQAQGLPERNDHARSLLYHACALVCARGQHPETIDMLKAALDVAADADAVAEALTVGEARLGGREAKVSHWWEEGQMA